MEISNPEPVLKINIQKPPDVYKGKEAGTVCTAGCCTGKYPLTKEALPQSSSSISHMERVARYS